MVTLGEMKQRCDALDVLQREYLVRTYHMKVDAPNVYKRYPPATDAEIAAGEKQYGMKCPPFYRMFLKVQGGWRRFGLGWSLPGPPRSANKDLWATIKQTLGRTGVVATEEEQQQLREKEKKDPRTINPQYHWIIGTDANYNLLVLDRNRISKDGEPEVVSTRYVIHVETRWKNLEAFFDDVMRRVEKRVRELRAMPQTEEKTPAKAAKTTGSRRSASAGRKPPSKPKKARRK
jgi:SMI1/KNR4 family protein SUKH-1